MKAAKHFQPGFVSLWIAMAATLTVSEGASAGPVPPTPVRFATFNASLNRFNAGDLATELSAPGSAQPDTVAEIIQRVRPTFC